MPMHVIPVIDLMDGVVVRGVAGRRSEYRPIVSRIAKAATPTEVARAFAEELGFDTVYVADLDAIQLGRPSFAAWQAIAATGMNLWLDAGIGTAAAARAALDRLAKNRIDAHLVVGLESLHSDREFEGIAEHCRHPPIFSLDLHAGRPLTRNQSWQLMQPLALALLAVSWGIGELIVLDLADVGAGGGTRTLDLCRQFRQAAPQQQVVAGGGVRGVADLRAMQSAGCCAALVASALHDGRLTSADLAEFRS